MERLDCDRTAWEDSSLPSLWTESPVENTIEPLPTDIVQLEPSRCSLLSRVGERVISV